MKNATLTITFDSEKLDALTYHMDKKEADLQGELNGTMQKLYEKHVPQATREYIEDKIKRDVADKNKPKRPSRPTQASAIRGQGNNPA
jgi:hypothetical protein